MSSIVIAGDTSGSVTLQAPAVAGSTVLNLPSTSGTIQTSGAGYTTNGVAYATSTSALSTGSALTFDGTSLQLGTGGTTPAVKYGNGYQTLTGASDSNDFTYRTYANHIWKNTTSAGSITDGTELMRLTSTGLGIGTSSPAGKLDVRAGTGATLLVAADATNLVSLNNYNSTSGFQDLKYAGSTHQFFTGTAGGGSVSERVRIDAAGNFLVATTNTSSSAGNGLKVNTAGGVYAVGTTGDTYNFYNSTASAYRFYVTNAGVINATSTTITAISDQRLKENIQDIDVGLDAVLALKPRKFDWKAGKGKDKKGDRGWIAQEFETVFPDMITIWKDEPPEGEEPYKAVNADLIPILVKAIQEQQALINTLTDRISVLENK